MNSIKNMVDSASEVPISWTSKQVLYSNRVLTLRHGHQTAQFEAKVAQVIRILCSSNQSPCSRRRYMNILTSHLNLFFWATDHTSS